LSTAPFVTLPRGLLAECEAEACRSFPKETGGAFMGRRASAGEYRIEHMIGPGPKADHRKTSFKPDAEWQWSEMRRIHVASPGIAFLGDWHTHPKADGGRLSRTDLKALVEILSSEETRSNAVLSIIVSGKPRRWSWNAWQARMKAHGEARPTLWMERLNVVSLSGELVVTTRSGSAHKTGMAPARPIEPYVCGPCFAEPRR